jgi:hypothetical protein
VYSGSAGGALGKRLVWFVERCRDQTEGEQAGTVGRKRGPKEADEETHRKKIRPKKDRYSGAPSNEPRVQRGSRRKPKEESMPRKQEGLRRGPV